MASQDVSDWICNHCTYKNRKMMIGANWHHNDMECGLCGQRRNHSNNSLQFEYKTNSLPPESESKESSESFNMDEWVKLKKDKRDETPKCNYDPLKQHQIYLEKANVQDITNYLQRCIKEINRPKLNEHKDKIISYCKINDINGEKILKMGKEGGKKGFVEQLLKEIGDTKAKSVLSRLYLKLQQYDINCTALKRVAMILNKFVSLSNKVCYIDIENKQIASICNCIELLFQAKENLCFVTLIYT